MAQPVRAAADGASLCRVRSRGFPRHTSGSEALLASPADLVHQADLLEQKLNEKIGEIGSRALAKEDEDSKRLMSIPVVGSLIASAAFAPENFRSERDFAA